MFSLLITAIQLIILGIQIPMPSEDVFKWHTEGLGDDIAQICNFPVPLSRRKMESQAVATKDTWNTGPFSKTRTVTIPCLTFTLHRVSSTRELGLQDCDSYGSDSSCFYTIWNGGVEVFWHHTNVGKWELPSGVERVEIAELEQSVGPF